MKRRRNRKPDLADPPELHQREKARRDYRLAPIGQRAKKAREFIRATAAAIRAGA